MEITPHVFSSSISVTGITTIVSVHYLTVHTDRRVDFVFFGFSDYVTFEGHLVTPAFNGFHREGHEHTQQ